MCCIRKRSMSKCRSCRKDSSGAVKSVQPGCSWIQFLWPANSLVAIYSEMRFLMSGVSNLFCLQGIWQSKKQLLRKAQMLLQNCGDQRPAHSSRPSPSRDAGTLTAASRTTNKDYSLLHQLFRAASYNWLKHFMAGVLEITPLSDKVSIVVIVFKTSSWPPPQELCTKQRVWALIYSWSATTINYTDRKNASLLLERWPNQNAVLLRCLTTKAGRMDEDLHRKRNIHFYWTQELCEVAAVP